MSGFAENLDAFTLTPPKYAEKTAIEKARAVLASLDTTSFSTTADTLVIAADTIVEAPGGGILEKPADAAAAAAMLRRLSNATHEVHTGVAIAVRRKGSEASMHSFSESTRVTFAALDESLIAAYVATGEPFDKAGGYGIQGAAGCFVTGIHGCFYNVMGLPIHRLSAALRSIVLAAAQPPLPALPPQ